MKKVDIENILKILSEETKKIKKKKKKFSPVSIAPIRRPMGSMFFMDAGVSMSESEQLNEASRSIIKPITKKFDHLKWKLNDFQKQFLDDFISVPDESLKEDDFKYASKQTGIPINSLRSIKNTYSENKTAEEIAIENKRTAMQLGLGGDLDEKTIHDANREFSGARELPKDNKGKSWSMNPEPNFRSKSMRELEYEKEMSGLAGGNLKRISERELPNFMYEWLLYFIEGSETNTITESKILNDFHSNKFDDFKYIYFSFNVSLKESKAHAYDLASTDSKLKTLKEFTEKVSEFNSTFGTNFVVANQFTGEDGFLKVVLENAQLTDGKNVYNKKFINMEDNDIKKAISLGFYDQFTTTKSITG